MNQPLRKARRISWTLVSFLPFVMLIYGCGSESKGTSAETPKKTGEDETLHALSLDENAMAKSGIKVEPVRRQVFRSHRDFPGTIELDQRKTANVTTLVGGRASHVDADLGQEVEPGTVLATLDSREFADAQSAYLKAKAILYVVSRAYERAKVLLKEDIISVAEGQRREGEMVRAQAETREAYQRLRLMGMSDVQIKQLAQSRTVQSRVHITAPFHGFVIARNIVIGEVVETTETLFVIADLSHMWVIADVPENDVPFLPAKGTPRAQAVEVRLPSYPNEAFRGPITYVGNVVDPRTRTLRVRLELPNPDFKLKAEMYALIRIVLEPEEQALVVPQGAVQSRREKQFVFLQSGRATFEVRWVETGESNGEMTTIVKGLQEGDYIVTKNAFTLKSELFGDQV
ncbi:MAG: efflux RND transporter periplasmic adaptor subunit [Nitrospira sp.]|nr:efflux RND transporter periplasmic adaptor subunit [Nitrospira sp.]